MRLLFVILFVLSDIIPYGQAILTHLQKRDSVLVADQFEYGFRLDSVRLGTSLALQDFSEFENDSIVLVRNWQTDTLKRDGDFLSLCGSVVVAPFEEGLVQLPPIAVRRVLQNGKVDTLLFDAPQIDVRPLQVDTASFVIHDIKGQMRYPLTFKEMLPWIGGGVLLLLLIAGIIALVRYISEKRAGVDGGKKEPAYIVALKALERYRDEKYRSPDRQKAYYSGITDTLKQYICATFGVDALEMTTSELFSELKADAVRDDALYGEVKSLFELADFVKFAKHTASESETASALPLAVRFVTQTHQNELEEGQNQEKDVL